MGILKYLLDTNICIYIIKQRPPQVRDHFAQLNVGEVGMSIITYGELLYGAEKSQRRAKVLDQLGQLAQYIPPLRISSVVAKYYGETRAALEKKGKPIGNNDLWIAAHALSSNLTLVTNNEKEFSRIEKLKIENWC